MSIKILCIHVIFGFYYAIKSQLKINTPVNVSLYRMTRLLVR